MSTSTNATIIMSYCMFTLFICDVDVTDVVCHMLIGTTAASFRFHCDHLLQETQTSNHIWENWSLFYMFKISVIVCICIKFIFYLTT